MLEWMVKKSKLQGFDRFLLTSFVEMTSNWETVEMTKLIGERRNGDLIGTRRNAK